MARLVVEATPNSETDFDVSATQLEESEETRRPKHKTSPRQVSKDEHDARQIAHLQSRSRSGETVDHAHRPQAGTHGGEDRRGKDYLFSSNAAVLQYVNAVLNRLESGAAFSVMSGNGVEARLVGAREPFRPTDRTRLTEMRAVKNPVCNTPKASSVNAESSERARRLRNDPEHRDHGSKGIGGTCLQSDALHGAELCVADNTPPCEARQGVSEFTELDTGEVRKREFAGADQYGDAKRFNAGTESR